MAPNVVAIVVVVVTALVASMLVAHAVPAHAAARPAGRVGAPPPSDLKRLAQAAAEAESTRVAADAAAKRYADGLTKTAALDAEIAALKAKIREGRAAEARLRKILAKRAVALYQGYDPGSIMLLADAPDFLTAARRARLIAAAAVPDRQAAAELRRTTNRIARQREEVDARREEQAKVTELLAADARRLEDQLASAAEAQREISRLSGHAFEPVDGLLCPIAGPLAFTNDWGQPRSGGRTHKGTDLFNPRDTPNVAIVNGVMRPDQDDLGGTGVQLYGDNGTRYYYAHLSRVEGGARRVAQGEIVGYTGNTGNAAGGPTHTHFQIHPGGGEPVNPYPTIAKICRATPG